MVKEKNIWINISPGQTLIIPFFSFTITINLPHTKYSPTAEHTPCAEQMDWQIIGINLKENPPTNTY